MLQTFRKYQFLAFMILALLLLSCQPTSKESKTSGSGIFKADPAFDLIVPASATIEKLAGGLGFTEGPIWALDTQFDDMAQQILARKFGEKKTKVSRKVYQEALQEARNSRKGYLLFSDIPANSIFKWTPKVGISLYRKQSGYDGGERFRSITPGGNLWGSNGLTLDSEGRLIICEHGNRRVTRLEEGGDLTVLADKYEGKRLNSPNDAVYKSDGSLYFTDPPYGFAEQDEDPNKELEFNGVYRLAGEKLQLLHSEMTRPNGLAFSPSEKYLYVANSDPEKKLWMRFEVQEDGTISEGTTFYDVTQEAEDGLPDGMKVDQEGNLYCTGPGGVWIFSPDGKHLGTIKPPEPPANCHWGDEDGKTLYMTARTGLYRIRLNIAGIRPSLNDE